MLLRVVKDKCRGMGIGREQERVQLEYAARRKSVSLYADVMTHDCVSQHGLATNGFILTGLRPVLYKASVMVPDMAWPEGARLSQAVMCRRGAMEDAGEIYCPAEHRAVAEEIYARLGVGVCLRDCAGACRSARSYMRNPTRSTTTACGSSSVPGRTSCAGSTA